MLQVCVRRSSAEGLIVWATVTLYLSVPAVSVRTWS